MSTRPFQIGDRVAYSATFLRAMGHQTAGQIDRMRGTIRGFAPDWADLAEIEWDSAGRASVNVFNLIHARPSRICNEATMADSRSGHGPDQVAYGGRRRETAPFPPLRDSHVAGAGGGGMVNRRASPAPHSPIGVRHPDAPTGAETPALPGSLERQGGGALIPGVDHVSA